MSRRFAYLYWLALTEVVRQIRYDFGREIVVFVSSSVLFATFLYVFNDFLNVQVTSLSPAMRDAIAMVLQVVLLAVTAAASGRLLAREKSRSFGIRPTAVFLGEDKRQLRSFALLWRLTLIAGPHAIAWGLAWRFLLVPKPLALLGTEVAMLMVTGIFAKWPRYAPTFSSPAPKVRTGIFRQAPNEGRGRPQAQPGHEGELALARPGRDFLWPSLKFQRLLGFAPKSQVTTLTLWRLEQIRLSRMGRLCLLLASAFLILTFVTGALAAPPFVAVLTTLTAGYLVAVLLAFQLADDMQHAWVERNFGVTHAAFVAAYERLAWLLGGTVGAGAFLLYASGSLLAILPANDFAAFLPVAGKLFVLGALPSALMPCLAFQIDARRAGVNLLLTFIAGLFVGTAIFANWLGILLWPILRYAAEKQQAGRFYRA